LDNFCKNDSIVQYTVIMKSLLYLCNKVMKPIYEGYWNVALCGLIQSHWHFGETSYFLLEITRKQGCSPTDKPCLVLSFWDKYLSLSAAAVVLALFHVSVCFPIVAYSSALKMEVADSCSGLLSLTC